MTAQPLDCVIRAPNQVPPGPLRVATQGDAVGLAAFGNHPQIDDDPTTKMSQYAVRVHPGELHFNAAHFITFNGTCENLHGHNFHVRIDARGENTDDAFVIDFVLLTRLAAQICKELHDGVLLPAESREVRIEERDGLVSVHSYDKRFVLPRESCILLPLPNTTAEMLAFHISRRLMQELERAQGIGKLRSLEVAVEEADQQWGVYTREVARDA